MIELFHEAGTVNARMIKVMLDLDTRSTSRLITDLVGRELLVKQAGAQRGPAVTYLPGPRFPAKQLSSRRRPPTDPNQLAFDLGDDG